MRLRHTLALFFLLACGRSHGPEGGTLDGGRDSGPPLPVPDGGEGVCCPIAAFSGCSPGFDPLPAGGWATNARACTYTISGFDGQPFVRRTDDRGCAILVEDREATPCGSIPVDAGVDAGPSACDGLGLVACLGESGCAPRWDDGCCPSCVEPGEPVACADCFAAVYDACWTQEEACSLVGISCGATPAESCEGEVVNCEGARVGALDSCDRYGCIPAYPSGMGAPDVERAICVPATADSCTVACRRVAPPCPTGTVPEGDGFCYTDRCIPAMACE
ncbi:MAG: hypothetical protein H6721_30615 [Sandaracinus sp.]|nr:hypothetical protein [Myxococcales bacterium]MCB9613639.1 hypothetical protein [Sandaracinus sp.]MCB9636484.1 hypothetical protein [Sandaracinus sp.]